MAVGRSRLPLPRRPRPRASTLGVGDSAPEVSMEPRPGITAPPVDQSVVDAAIYRNGTRVESPPTVAGTCERLGSQPDQMAWIGLFRPEAAQLYALGDEFGLH